MTSPQVDTSWTEPLELPDSLPTEGPTVNVLVPLFNYETYIGECIASILTQTYRSIEVVIVDNCSTDGSLAAARAAAQGDARVRFVSNTVNVGCAPNFRRCYEESHAPLVQFICADDRFSHDQALATLVAAIGTDPGIALATSRRGQFEDAGGAREVVDYSRFGITGNLIADATEVGNLFLSIGGEIFGQFVPLFRRERLSVEDFFRLGDTDIGAVAPSDIGWWLAIAAGAKVAYVDELLVEYRQHGGSQSSRVIRDPRWWSGWFKIVAGARSAGYLSDPVTESTILHVRCLNLKNNLSQLDTSDSAAMEELVHLNQAATDRIRELGIVVKFA